MVNVVVSKPRSIKVVNEPTNSTLLIKTTTEKNINIVSTPLNVDKSISLKIAPVIETGICDGGTF